MPAAYGQYAARLAGRQEFVAYTGVEEALLPVCIVYVHDRVRRAVRRHECDLETIPPERELRLRRLRVIDVHRLALTSVTTVCIAPSHWTFVTARTHSARAKKRVIGLGASGL